MPCGRGGECVPCLAGRGKGAAFGHSGVNYVIWCGDSSVPLGQTTCTQVGCTLGSKVGFGVAAGNRPWTEPAPVARPPSAASSLRLTAAEAVNHKRQLAQMVERELALTGADSVTDFDDALQMVLVETAFGRYPKHLLDVYTKAQQNRTEQNRQKLKNRKNIQEQTKPYLQNKQLILACGSRARQRLPADGQKCDMESQVGHIAINRPDKAHQSLIYYARAHTHARSAKMTKNMAVLRSL